MADPDVQPNTDVGDEFVHDAFISHASEDKVFVKQLTDTMMRMGISVWYDDYELRVGDSIRGAINEGLLASRFGVVVLSPNFIKKPWPKRELAALSNLAGDEPRLLPILHNMSIGELTQHEPLLADVKAAKSSDGWRAVAYELAARIKGPADKAEDGRARYYRQTVRLVDVPRDANDRVSNVILEECIIQGPAILFLSSGIVISECWFNSEYVTWPVERGRPYIGSVGTNNVDFKGCRFKDIGFATPDEEPFKRMNLTNTPIPQHLI